MCIRDRRLWKYAHCHPQCTHPRASLPESAHPPRCGHTRSRARLRRVSLRQRGVRWQRRRRRGVGAPRRRQAALRA
eukprot:4574158-Alexandrium_andersonii.AAC.1